MWLGLRHRSKPGVRLLSPLAALAATALVARSTAAPPALVAVQVGADRLRSAPRSALRSNPGYTQRRQPRVAPHSGLSLHTLRSGLGTALVSLAWGGPASACVYVTLFCPPHTIHTTYSVCTQVVQRSLSGGFLTEDARLLNANARSIMLDEAIATTPGKRGCPRREPYTAQGMALHAATRGARPQKPAVSCGRSPRHTPHVYEAHRSWSWPLRATTTKTRALLTTHQSRPLTS